MKYSGLKEKDVIEKQKIYGLNKIYIKRKYNIFYESILYILLISIIINLTMYKFIFSFVLSLLLILYILIYYFMNKKLSIILDDHNKNFYYKVIRDNKDQMVDKSNIVVGDIILFEENDEVCADVMILESNVLIVDESFYDYKRSSIEKNSVYSKSNSYLKNNYLYTGSVILQGNAICKVIGTGFNTEYVKKIRDKISTFKWKFLYNKWINIYIIYNVLNLIMFLFSLVLNNYIVLSLSFALSSTYIYLLLLFYFIIILVKCDEKSLYISDIKELYKIIKYKNIFITHEKLNNNKIVIDNVTPYKTSVENLKKNLFLATNNESIKQYLNIDNDMELISSIYKYKLNFNIYKKNDELFLYVCGNPESIFDICNLDLDYKYQINTIIKEKYVEGIKLICIGHKKIDKILDNPLEYIIDFDGYVCYKNYINSNIINTLKKLNEYFRIYIFMNDSKYFVSKYFRDVDFINNKYVINKKEYSMIKNNEIYECLNEINLYSNFDIKTINNMYKKFDNTLIFNNNKRYYIKNNNLESLIDSYKKIKSMIIDIKKIVFINILISILLIILSFYVEYIFIGIIKFLILIINIIYYKKMILIK